MIWTDESLVAVKICTVYVHTSPDGSNEWRAVTNNCIKFDEAKTETEALLLEIFTSEPISTVLLFIAARVYFVMSSSPSWFSIICMYICICCRKEMVGWTDSQNFLFVLSSILISHCSYFLTYSLFVYATFCTEGSLVLMSSPECWKIAIYARDTHQQTSS